MKEQIKDALRLIEIALVIWGIVFVFILIGKKLGLNDKILEIITWPLIISMVIIYALKVSGRLTSKDFWRNTSNITKRTIINIIGLSFKLIGMIILLILLIWIAPKIVSTIRDSFREKYWTLFLYSADTPNTDYLIQRIDGYKSQRECLEKGFELTRDRGSYECGYDCRYRKEYEIEICDKVCTRFGCR
jgi:hypothetical protein